MSQINIWIAASDGNLTYVREQISSGKHTANDADANGYTPMHAAASYGHIELLKYLVSVGGNVNLQDEEGDTPLHSVEDVKTAATLVEELGADWKLKNNEEQTPLAVAEEEDEFPELIAYFRSLQGSSIIPDNNNNNASGSSKASTSRSNQNGEASGQIEPSLIEELYANPSISLSYKTVSEDNDESNGGSSADGADFDSEQRKEIETIINGENAEENLQKYMQKLLEKQFQQQLGGQAEDEGQGHSEKRKKTN